ncbi:MAG TPA: type II secretion system protein [Chlamydiales bacterium]|nr:type II secretion system protein [Chlamydiales bacterium]
MNRCFRGRLRIRQQSFSLLEIIVALALLIMAAGAVGWKMYPFLAQRKFRIHLAQLKSRIQTIQRVALNMQSDWRGVLKKHHGDDWIFEVFCMDDPTLKSFSPISVYSREIFLNGERQDGISFEFFSTGEIQPKGILLFRRDQEEKWDLLKILGKEEGDGIKKPGPIHPDDV